MNVKNPFEKYSYVTMTYHNTPHTLLLADTTIKRMKGLVGFNEFPKDVYGMFFKYGKPVKHWISTFGMHFNIDILFLDKDNNISELYCNIKPGVLIIPKNKYYNFIETVTGLIF